MRDAQSQLRVKSGHDAPKADIRQRMLEPVVDRFSSLGLRLDAGSDTRH